MSSSSPRHGRTAWSPPTDSANLDCLRAYAVLFVYVGHLLQTLRVDGTTHRVTIFDVAQTGVLIFFVHTSLVLLLSLERLDVTGWRLFAVFYTRRLFRIYPLSMLTVAAMVAFRIPPFRRRTIRGRAGRSCSPISPSCRT